MNNDEINVGLDALQAAYEKRISGDLQVLEDSDAILDCADWMEQLSNEKYRLATFEELQKWVTTLRRIAIPRPMGERE